ncbi:queuosine salvage family protein [Conexibacter sp. SYSU D00693]|uniref:queuosine salvage family protein n=1 Tax=Conexibacter sp. SYSU D00693 TaxID=2812560 RepID=UPI00196AAF7B|nr:queuosine salvage family protein [Conexibacter sp. SYSU D00693]
MPGLLDEVRASCAAIAADARSVRIAPEALERLVVSEDVPAPTLDPERHFLEGSELEVATYLLVLDAVNFGSGWFPTLRKRALPDGSTVSGYFTVAWALADRWRAHGSWTNDELRAMRTEEVADVLGQRRDHELMSLYAQALRELGRFLGDHTALDLVTVARGSAERLAEAVVEHMALWDDRGFFKRAQILAHDLAIAGLASFTDLDRLTIFADNLVPHVLRVEGALVLDPELEARIDREELLPPGREERELRACALHACELVSARTGVAPRVLDVWLWNRGQAQAVKARPRHRTRCVFY